MLSFTLRWALMGNVYGSLTKLMRENDTLTCLKLLPTQIRHRSTISAGFFGPKHSAHKDRSAFWRTLPIARYRHLSLPALTCTPGDVAASARRASNLAYFDAPYGIDMEDIDAILNQCNVFIMWHGTPRIRCERFVWSLLRPSARVVYVTLSTEADEDTRDCTDLLCDVLRKNKKLESLRIITKYGYFDPLPVLDCLRSSNFTLGHLYVRWKVDQLWDKMEHDFEVVLRRNWHRLEAARQHTACMAFAIAFARATPALLHRSIVSLTGFIAGLIAAPFITANILPTSLHS